MPSTPNALALTSFWPTCKWTRIKRGTFQTCGLWFVVCGLWFCYLPRLLHLEKGWPVYLSACLSVYLFLRVASRVRKKAYLHKRNPLSPIRRDTPPNATPYGTLQSRCMKLRHLPSKGFFFFRVIFFFYRKSQDSKKTPSVIVYRTNKSNFNQFFTGFN